MSFYYSQNDLKQPDRGSRGWRVARWHQGTRDKRFRLVQGTRAVNRPGSACMRNRETFSLQGRPRTGFGRSGQTIARRERRHVPAVHVPQCGVFCPARRSTKRAQVDGDTEKLHLERPTREGSELVRAPNWRYGNALWAVRFRSFVHFRLKIALRS